MSCKRITGQISGRADGAISLMARSLYYAHWPGRQKLVTQKVRPRVIYGEESLSPQRLFGADRKRKVYRQAPMTDLKLCKFLNQRVLPAYYKTRH